MSYQLNIGSKLVKHQFKVLAKYQLVSVCFYMSEFSDLQIYICTLFKYTGPNLKS